MYGSKCSHFYDVNRCPIEGCENHDVRPLLIQIFSPDANSALAAELFRTNRAEYDRLKKLAIEAGRLPKPPRLACFDYAEDE